MSPELFEHLAAQAFAAERVRMELLGWSIRVRPAGDGAHAGILSWLVRQSLAQRPDLDLITSGLGLKVGPHHEGRTARTESSLQPLTSTMRASGPSPKVSWPWSK